MNQRLNDEQTRLYDEFYNMDVTISQLQSDASVIATIGPIDISGDTSSSSSTSPTPVPAREYSSTQVQAPARVKGRIMAMPATTVTLPRKSIRPRASSSGCSSRRQSARRTAPASTGGKAATTWPSPASPTPRACSAEVLAAIDRDGGGELAQRVSGLYEFIFRLLVRAGHRQTKRAFATRCESWKSNARPHGDSVRRSRPIRRIESAYSPPTRTAVVFDFEPSDVADGFSLEA